MEIGLFDKLTGASALDDTMHIVLVNRRAFERALDIPDTSALGRAMDSLAESRRLVVRLANIKHPDTTQYNFLHIKEVAPDTNRLPFATAARRGLDTVIRADSVFAIWLRPGGGALLRITYCKPNDSLAAGDLRFNNQKKWVFDGTYWHAAYHRKLKFWKPPLKNTQTTEDVVYYRRSLPADSSLGAIRWDPQQQFEVLLSDTTTDGRYIENRFPSITVRNDESDTGRRVVTVVWSRYGNNPSGRREVMLRNIRVYGGDSTPALGPIEKVAEYWGREDDIWGTPVVSRLHGGYVVAWSDSLHGVLARLRRLDKAGNWWTQNGTYFVSDSVSRQFTAAGVYPSMPPFAHVKGRDSSVAIVWGQPEGTAGVHIRYARLIHRATPTLDTLVDTNRIRISQATTATHLRPSIDMTQNVWFGAQEGVAWESKESVYDSVSEEWSMRVRLHFSSLWTETSRACMPGGWRPYHDCIEGVNQWTYNTLDITDLPLLTEEYIYPSTASPNARIDTVHALDSIYFSIATSPIPDVIPMQQSMVQYATTFLWPQPRTYLIGGHYPNMASSLTRLATYEAALFQKDRDSASALETTRQFFAKSRPRGYMAYGRQVHFRLSDSAVTAISGALHDVWYSGDGGGGALRLIERPDSLRQTDSLAVVRKLFRTGYFHAHDSTTIGCTLRGRLVGDTTLASDMRVEFITELVDSATDNVVARIDSFAIAPGLDSASSQPQLVYDLLSGTYYVRMRIEPVNVTVDTVAFTSLYPVEELASYVMDAPLGKVRHLNSSAAQWRITAQPNPVLGVSELRFSVPSECRATLRVFDGEGREVKRLMYDEMIKEGRYAIDFDASTLSPGAYFVEFRCGTRRIVEKIVVMR